ncbi:DUF916 and DUF3324 domain-containing protein [Enterococcus sp. 5H]|uniref:DUF916 and DUF3324 domain-containing protein n=1 Tax=Enterococcus sp. 5H TaxID=1229490 RepID=UPI0023031F68|nr:DUF916 and DUF3324 domain-containing protein [Enterococcus sp. 5H]MDA9470110.1 hypothetical protein [Enterococcus sp. 5H]
MLNKNKVIKSLFFSILICLIFVVDFYSAYADSEQSFADFTVDAKLPDNQFSKDVTYFDVKVDPGQKQQLEVVLKNNSSKEIEIIPSFNRAQTNRSGVVTYSTKSNDEGAGLKYNIEDIVKISDKKIVLKANEEYTLKLQIDMPDGPFDGILAGGLYLLNNSSGESEGNIKNYFAREIGVILREQESSKDILGDIELINVSSGQEASRNAISVLLENSQPAYLNGFSLKGTITKKGETDPTINIDRESLSMAPNSIFDLSTSLNGKPYVAGTYIFKAQAKKDDRVWDLEKEFEITAKEAKKYNKVDVSIDKTSIFDNKLVVAMMIVLMLLVFVIVILIIRMILNKKKEKKRKYNLNKKRKKRKNSNRKK